MKTFLMLLSLSALMTISCFSQITYPKKIVLGQDTLIILTPTQLAMSNFFFADRDRLYEVNDTLNYVIDNYISLVDELNKRDSLRLLELKWNKEINDLSNSISDEYKNALKNANVEIKKQKIYKYSGYSVAVILLTLLILK